MWETEGAWSWATCLALRKACTGCLPWFLARQARTLPKPRVRWLNHVRRQRAQGQGYLPAGTDEECARFAIGGESSEEEVHNGASSNGHLGGSAVMGGDYADDNVYGAPLPVSALMPSGRGTALLFGTPSGAQIKVPLPAGVTTDQSVHFELLPAQLAALPAEDIIALREGRFLVQLSDASPSGT